MYVLLPPSLPSLSPQHPPPLYFLIVNSAAQATRSLWESLCIHPDAAQPCEGATGLRIISSSPDFKRNSPPLVQMKGVLSAFHQQRHCHSLSAHWAPSAAEPLTC